MPDSQAIVGVNYKVDDSATLTEVFIAGIFGARSHLSPLEPVRSSKPPRAFVASQSAFV